MIAYSAPVRQRSWVPHLGQLPAQTQTPTDTVKASQIPVPPFGLPMIESGAILVAAGLVSGALGIYWATKGAKVIGKKIPTFWQFMFNTGGVGVVMSVLGAIPLVALGSVQIAGGAILAKS